MQGGGQGGFQRPWQRQGAGQESTLWRESWASEPGLGETVVQALCSVLTEDIVRVVVAGANGRAVRLYQRMGFLAVRQTDNWFRIL